MRRNITSSWVSAPTSTATLTYSYSSVAGYGYRLSAGCAGTGKVLLTVTSRSQSKWATFEVDETTGPNVLRPLADGSGFQDGALVRAGYMEPEALVLPLVSTTTGRLSVARVPRSQIAQRPAVSAARVWSVVQ